MAALPHNAKIIELLRWVASHQNEPFDPNMVVSLSTGHTSDWEWQAVLGQMEDLRQQNYILKLKQDPAGSSYWAITERGMNYMRALDRFETPTDAVPADSVAVSGTPASGEVILLSASPVPTPKNVIAPLLERIWLWIQEKINWDELPTHLTSHLAYDLIRLVGALLLAAIIAGVSFGGYHLFRWLIFRALH
jgi:hypothetical protein